MPKFNYVFVLALLCLALIPGCSSFDAPQEGQEGGDFLQVKVWEGWVRVDITLKQEGDRDFKEQIDRFVVEVTLDDQVKYTTSNKWTGQGDEAALWEQSDYYRHYKPSTNETIWESYGAGTGHGRISLEIDEGKGSYYVSVGASLEKLNEVTRVRDGRRTFESEMYEFESGRHTYWVDLPSSGLVLEGQLVDECAQFGTREIIEWKFWPKG